MSLELGLAELAQGRWEAARAALADGEEPEALEALSWAAWWLDDANAVFEARERAFRLYRRRGDAAGAARMAVWLACDEHDFHGAASVASGWLQRARRLLEPLEPAPEHGWLAFHGGYLALVTGDSGAAARHGVEAAEIGRAVGVADLEMLGLALQGRALVGQARVGEGMSCLDEATATALAADAVVPISSAWTFCLLVSACV
jgi:LuxR family transcriptional regulator, maltose regulon positive regulatory protein